MVSEDEEEEEEDEDGWVEWAREVKERFQKTVGGGKDEGWWWWWWYGAMYGANE